MLVPLTLPVHGESHRKHRHAYLAHGVGGLSAEESRVDGRRNDNDPSIPAPSLEMK